MRERLRAGILMRTLLPLINLLLELPPLLLIRKAQPEHALLALKAEEEDSVLIVLEGVVDFLVPDDAAVGGGDVDDFEPERVAHEVVGEHDGAGEAGVGPLVARVRVGDVEFGDGDGVDFVRGFGHDSFDDLLLVVGEDGGHDWDLYSA
jgi:hypothetical protein